MQFKRLSFSSSAYIMLLRISTLEAVHELINLLVFPPVEFAHIRHSRWFNLFVCMQNVYGKIHFHFWAVCYCKCIIGQLIVVCGAHGAKLAHTLKRINGSFNRVLVASSTRLSTNIFLPTKKDLFVPLFPYLSIIEHTFISFCFFSLAHSIVEYTYVFSNRLKRMWN